MATKNETESTGAPPPEGTDPPKYLTADDLNTALTARLKPFEQKLEKMLETSVGQSLAKLRDELVPKPAPAPAAAPEAKGEAKKKEESPELRALHDQVAQLTRQAEEARAERDAERAKARDTTMRQRVADALAAGGVEGVRTRHAVGFLVDAEKRVRWNDDHTALTFRENAGDVDLEAGVRAWLKSEDGKYYLPARAAVGSGDRPGASPPPRAPGAPIDRASVAEGLRRALTGQLG